MADEELYFSGKKFISLKRASEISGYVKDYIGQLCRADKIEARRVGRDWFVNFDNLVAYKNKKKQPKIYFEKSREVPMVKSEFSESADKSISGRRDFIRGFYNRINNYIDVPIGFFRAKITSILAVFKKSKSDPWDKEMFGASSKISFIARKILEAPTMVSSVFFNKINFTRLQKAVIPVASSVTAVLLVIGFFAYSNEIGITYAKWFEPTVKNISSIVDKAAQEIIKKTETLAFNLTEISEIKFPEIKSNF